MGPLKLAPLGFMQLTSFAVATAQGQLSGPAGSQVALLTPTGGTVTFRDDGNAPTTSIGIPIATGLLPFEYWGNLSQLSVIGASASAVLNVSFYKIAG